MTWYFQSLRKYAASTGRAWRLLMMTLFVLLVVTSVPGLAQAATSEAGSCAVFAADGTSAAATYDDKTLSLEITDPAGKTSVLSSPSLRPVNPYYVPNREAAPETCRIFFDG